MSQGMASMSTGTDVQPLNIPPSLRDQNGSAFVATSSSSKSKPLTSAAEVHRALRRLAEQSKRIDGELERQIYEAQRQRDNAQQSLAQQTGRVSLIADEARVLERRLKDTGRTAERISESVRKLDEQSDRVKKALHWTARVADLKASLQSMASAIEQRDYTAATQHCTRALSIDQTILHSNFAALMVPTSEHPDPPSVLLLELRKNLLAVFTNRFEAATAAKDTQEATKYFTMFPLVGWTAEGLEVYAKFARSLVHERGRLLGEQLANERSGASLYHAALLTQLFEMLAALIDQHQPLVDHHYGIGNFTKSVMPELQEECDRLGRRVCDTWYDERYVRRKLEEAKSHTFTFASTIGASKKSATTSTGQRLASGFNIPGRPSTPSTVNQPEEAPQVDTREVDRIVGEVAAMAGRWATYKRFLAVRLDDGGANATSSAPASASEDKAVVATSADLKDFRTDGKDGRRKSLRAVSATSTTDLQQQQETNTSTGQGIITASQLGKRIDDLLDTVYVPLESWFLRCSIEKAHKMDMPDMSARPLSSSLLDDVFYLVRLVLARTVSTCNLNVLSTMSRNVRYIIDEDFVQTIVRILDNVSRTTSGSMNVEGPRKDAASREIRQTFGVYLNILSTSADYMGRILNELSSEANLSQHFTSSEIPIAASTIQGMTVLVPRIRNVARTHMDLLFSTLLRPRLRQIVSECMRDVQYVLNEEDFARAEDEAASHGGQSLCVRKLMRGWESSIQAFGYRDTFTQENWEMLLRLAVDTIVQSWEAFAINLQYSELGALRFDKDVRGISTFLVSQSAVGGLRDRFGRLTHISYLVNLDDDDDNDADEGDHANADGNANSADRTQTSLRSLNAGGTSTEDDVAWRLSAAEVKLIRQRRVGW